MKMTPQPTVMIWDDQIHEMVEVPNEGDNFDHSATQGTCDRCGTLIHRFRGMGDMTCHDCGANYNCAGQRLRDDLHSSPNPSEYDDDIGDMEGYEIAMSRGEDW